MRRLATAERIRALVRRLGPAASQPTNLFLTGGATAVLLGWRDATIEPDLYRFPAVDPPTLRRAVAETIRRWG